MADLLSEWMLEAVSDFGAACQQALSGPGQPEAAIRSPLEHLLRTACDSFEIGSAAWHSETPLPDFGVRPDYSVEINGAIVGYIEIKRPDASVDPASFRGRNKTQWERLRDLPNLVYTNGTSWRLYQDGELVCGPVDFVGDLRKAGSQLAVETPAFDALLRSFLTWHPTPIRSARTLVDRVAPLCRLLRSAVEEQLAEERVAKRNGVRSAELPFTGLAQDWRKLLFPTAGDLTFADGYAQAVTFALLLARTEDISLRDTSLHDVGKKLGAGHSLMGKALQLLTDNVSDRFAVTLDLLIRVIGAVEWDKIRRGRKDAYLHLYESFLEVYDDDLRQSSGSYYTPREVVAEMVRLADEALQGHLDRPKGLGSEDVFIVDPAMGTGTYLHAIIEHVAQQTEKEYGSGMRPQAIGDLAERLVGFELQMGPFAVAELRASDLLKKYDVALPSGGLRLYVTNTLDNPWLKDEQIASTYAAISQSRARANKVKADTPVTVIIGNPPYKDKAEGLGGWIEHGAAGQGAAPLADFRLTGNGRYEHILKNLYIYFWRWATWKVFDAQPDDRQGVICFITPSGFINGPGGRGMRSYLRKTCGAGWIIDLTPEGQRPDVPTRIFPGVAQPLAICVFIRRSDDSADEPAVILYRKVTGRRADKYEQLKELSLDGDGWQLTRTDAEAPFTPASAVWDEFPALSDLFSWGSLGITSNRAWVSSPSRSVLKRRWDQLVREPDVRTKTELFKATRDRDLDKQVDPLRNGFQHTVPIGLEDSQAPAPVRIGLRSFDRQWLIPDRRVIDFPRPDLWEALLPGQLFLNQQSSHAIDSGPAIVATALLPDTHHFNGRGGRVHPMLHPNGSANVPPQLLFFVGNRLGLGGPVPVQDLAAYVMTVAGHRAFTERFTDELVTPGVRVPLTAEPELWHEAVELGREVIWASTYGTVCHDSAAGRPKNDVLYPRGDERQIRVTAAIEGVPSEIHHRAASRTLEVGSGIFEPVTDAVWRFDVGGKEIVKKWFGYRKANPDGKKTSPLDDIHVDNWSLEWVTELIELLTVLSRLVTLESSQDEILERILEQPTITVADLTRAGVLPVPEPARKPHRPVVNANEASEGLF